MLTRAVCPRADRRPLVGLLIVRRSGRDDAVGWPRKRNGQKNKFGREKKNEHHGRGLISRLSLSNTNQRLSLRTFFRLCPPVTFFAVHFFSVQNGPQLRSMADIFSQLATILRSDW